MHRHTTLWVNGSTDTVGTAYPGIPCTLYGVSPARTQATPSATLGTSLT